MRAQAKRSSAANRDGSALRGSVAGSRDDATRASSLSPGGSGAPSRRGRLTVLALAIAVLALLAFAPLAGAKEVTKFFGNEFGSSGSNSFNVLPFGGNFNNPRDIGVNNSGVGAPQGTIYVADDANHRIQRFDRNGRFVSAWGKDVIASAVDESHRLVLDASGGTFSLTFNGATTAPIGFDSQGSLSGSTLDNALDVLSSVGGDANVAVRVPFSQSIPNRFIIVFTGALAGRDLPQVTIDTSQLEGTARVTTLADGVASVANNTGTGFEICTVATECKDGVASPANGAMDNLQSVAVDSDTGTVYVSDRDNRRVNAYDAAGNFVRSWGWDVATGGATGTGTLSTASTTVSAVATTSGAFQVGQTVTSSTPGDIPAGTTILTVGSNSLTLSQKPIANGVETLTVATGAGNVGVNERQTITVSPAAVSGNFKLTFTAPNPQTVTNPQTTANIPWNATAAQVQAALDDPALTNIGAGNTTVTLNPGGNAGGGAGPGGPWTVTFSGPRYADTNVNALVRVNGSPNLNTNTGFAIATTQEGSTGFESCTDAGCKIGLAGAGAGQIGSTSTDGTLGIAVSPPDGNGATGSVFLADSGNSRIQEFDLSGNFVAIYGGGVVDGGAAGTGTVTNGSTSVTAVVTTSRAFAVGQQITGTGIDPGTKITALGAGTITLSTVANAGATGAGTALTVATPAANRANDEQQTVQVGPTVTSGNFKLTFSTPNPSNSSQTSANIPFNATVAEVQIALESLTNLGAGNVSVALNPGGDPGVGAAPGGPWTVTFSGRYADTNVDNLVRVNGSPNLNTNTGFTIATPAQGASDGEVCTLASGDFCRVATAAPGPGQFESTQPRRVAVDSRGILYASDSGNFGALDRYDTQDANGGGVGPLESIPASVNEVQRVTFSGFDEGDTFRLTCPNGVQTEDIRYFAGDYSIGVKNALDAACGAANVGGIFFSGRSGTVTFIGALGSRDVPQMSCTVVSSQFGGPCNVTTSTEGRTSALLAGDTNGLTVDPDSDGGGADEDALYVLRSFNAGGGGGEGAVQQLGPGNDPGLTVAPTAADAVHGAGAGFRFGVTGLGLDEASGRLFVSDTSVNNQSAPGGGIVGSGHRVYVLDDPLPDPAANLSAVTIKTDTTATFAAAVDPQGGLIRCTFQYATDFRFANPTDVEALGCNGFSPDGGFQTVSQRVTGLTPSTHYFVRLKTTRTFDSSAVATSSYVEFDTDSVPPAISDVGAIQVTDTSARLVGTIDPKNSATGYVFQYGTTPALGQQTAPLNIGGGSRPITVSQVITGLAKDTDHFFRLVASNGFGTTNSDTKPFHTRAVPVPPVDDGNCSNAALRAEQSSAHLQSCRAYEMVSPPEKNQGGVDQLTFQNYDIAFSRSGDAAAFCTTALFADAASGDMISGCASYISRRTAGGWQTTSPFPPHCGIGDREGYTALRSVALNPDFDRAFIELPESSSCPYGFLDPGATDQAANLYRQDLTTDPFQFDLVSGTPVLMSDLVGTLIGGSDDYSHAVFRSVANQTDPPDSPAQRDFIKLYEWVQEGEGACATPGGCMRLISKRPDGSPFTTGSDFPLDSEVINSVLAIGRAISADGERIFFYNGSGLYVREDAAITYDLGAPQCLVPADCTSGAAESFVWADEAADVALFRSRDKLTDASSSSGTKLYRWDGEGHGGCFTPGGCLTDLTLALADANGTEPSAQGAFIGAAEDGSVLYFVNSDLIAGRFQGRFLWRVAWNGGAPSAERLGPYMGHSPSGPGLGFTGDLNLIDRYVSVSADGGAVTISTPVALDPAADRDSDSDAYRWAVGEGWTCVSCQLPGEPSAGDVNTIIPECCDIPGLFFSLKTFGHTEHLISEDGQRVFFTARDTLVPQDTNGEVSCEVTRISNHNGAGYGCQDVYEWHDGTLSLISSGADPEGALLIGADDTGRNVAFVTRERLVGWDTDLATDLYTARIGGGFPEPAPVPPGCDLEAGACEDPGTVAADVPGAGSRAFEGAKNPPATFPTRCPRGKRKVTRNGRTRCVAKKRKRQNRAAKHNRRTAR